MRYILFAGHGVSGQIALFYPFPGGFMCVAGCLHCNRAMEPSVKKKISPIPSFPKRGTGKSNLSKMSIQIWRIFNTHRVPDLWVTISQRRADIPVRQAG